MTHSSTAVDGSRRGLSRFPVRQTPVEVAMTPVADVRVSTAGRSTNLRLKLEKFGPTGSVKDRTASAVVAALQASRPLQRGDVLIESTSGNLGLALLALLRPYGCEFVAVVDAHTPLSTVSALSGGGAEVIVVDEADESGGYLLNRLRTVRRLCAENPHYRWVNQYENPANPWAHESSTGPEILDQGGPALDAVYVAVSTGGTLAGISRHLRRHAPHVRIVAVDSRGSLATGGQPGPRLLPGIGSGRASSFLTAAAYDHVHRVPDVDAIAMCRHLLATTGLAVGGSSGSVLMAGVAEIAAGTVSAPLCLLPDGGDRYGDTVYDDRWLDDQGLLGQVLDRGRRLSTEVTFEAEGGAR